MDLQTAILANPFMTGHIPPWVWSPPRYGELRSYLPVEARVAMLPIMLYASGLQAWSWTMREPDWLTAATEELRTEIAIEYGVRYAKHKMEQSLGLMEAVMEAELMVRERGKRLYDPHTNTPLFPDEMPE